MAQSGSRWKRRVLIVLLVVVVAIALGVFALSRLIDVERHRGRIEEALEQTTGWSVELGELDLSILRGLALTVHPVRLTSPDVASKVDIELISVRARLMPLVRGELIVDRVELLRPEIRLVRRNAEQGWVLPVPVAVPRPTEPASEQAGLEVLVDEIHVRGGKIDTEDQTFTPPARLALEDVSMIVSPASGRVWGSAHISDGLGRLKWNGTLAEGVRLEIDALRSEVLEPWIGQDLIHRGAIVSGRVEIAPNQVVTGQLTADNVRLLAGEDALDEAALEFRVEPEGQGFELAQAALTSGATKLTAKGTLLPDVALDLDLAETPIEPALATARAAFPIPLSLTPPGTVQAKIRVELPSGGALSYSASGRIGAAAVQLAEALPPVENARADFRLHPSGALTVGIDRGTIGGGPVSGTAKLDRVYPPGTLRFEGNIAGADVGQLVSGLAPQTKGKLRGPADIGTALAVDLSRPTLGPEALSGRLEFSAAKLRIPGFDLEGSLQTAISEKLGGLGQLAQQALGDKLPTRAAADAEKGERLLDQLSAQISLEQLPWKLAPFALTVGQRTAAGKGSFDPRDAAVDLAVEARLAPGASAELVSQRGELRSLLDEQGRLRLPVRITGAMTAPTIDVELRGVLREKLTDQLRDELVEKLGGEDEKQDAKDAVKGLIDDLFKKKKK
ncbi:MAG: AsmA family protein [Acidobacteriota bacterium]|nr:MAG: AsmA family protein [Acidobacteriota bacterium]